MSLEFTGLEQIIPFNDVYYDSCYYNLFFSVITAFKKPLLPFLANDLFEYEFPDNVNGINSFLTCHRVFPNKSILDQIGISIEIELIRSDDIGSIIQRIKNYLENKFLIIITGDLFYWPGHSYFYNKHHSGGYYLIYGYNDGCFKIISDFADLSCGTDVITFKDFRSSLEGYCQFVNNATPIKLRKFINDKSGNIFDNSYYSKILARNILKNKDLLFEAPSKIGVLAEKVLDFNVEQIFYGDNFSKYEVSLWLNSLEKKAEKYRNAYLLKTNSNIIELMEKIFENWKIAHETVVMFHFYSSEKRESNLERIKQSLSKKLALIANLEELYINELMQLLN